jgi:hypothetical protein
MMEERGSGPRLIESMHRQAPVLSILAAAAIIASNKGFFG